MRSFTGSGGEVYLVSDPLRFTELPLEDCGDGFDWRASDPSLRHWVDADSLVFEVLEQGVWAALDPERVHPALGRVSFRRCLRGLPVRVSGVCVPVTLAGAGEQWSLSVGMATVPSAELGAEDQSFASVPQRSVAAIAGCEMKSLYESLLATARVRVVLPQGGGGAFVGLGTIAVRDSRAVNVNIDPEGVCYGPN